MVQGWLDFSALLCDKHVEFHIDVSSECFVLRVTIELGLLLLLILTAALGSSCLHLLDVVDHVVRARLVVLLHDS